MTSVLFVCTGNICRSPTADAVLRHLAQEQKLNYTIDSAGTHGYHIGEQPDPRTMQTAHSNGINMTMLRARKLQKADFENFDYLIAMDNGHLNTMQKIAPKEHHRKIHLFLDFTESYKGQDVPDPYYGEQNGFDHVFALVKEGCGKILESLNQNPT